jgi:hypothetical protein
MTSDKARIEALEDEHKQRDRRIEEHPSHGGAC